MILRLAVALAISAALPAADEPPASPAKPAAKPAAAVKPARLRASGQRNENVPVYQLDNNAIKEANIRLGSNVTLVDQPVAERSWFGREFGGSASELLVPAAVKKPPAWHADAYWNHQNSVFNARTFFQVGKVKPSRRSLYGGRFQFNLGDRTWISGSGGQRKIRGMVNGNVLVPLEHERTPLATDPAVYAEVARYLRAFPAELPNRPDFDLRALNTNAPQVIDQTTGALRLDRSVRSDGTLTLFYDISRMREDAFQFVAGMNPDTDIHNHRATASYAWTPDAQTTVQGGFVFQRSRSALVPEPNAVGPRVRFGYQIQELGPDGEFPVDRAMNTFRGGGQAQRLWDGGRHTLSFGGDLTRIQLNSLETQDHRGYYYFGNNFGRGAITNFLLGAPSFYALTIGSFYRGFRNWGVNAFVADRWQATPDLTVYAGLRYSLLTRPAEVNGLDSIPYPCDCNNFAPRLSLAWRFASGWVGRASYGVSFGEILPVTFQQVRNNLPGVRKVQVQNPGFPDPLRGVDLDDSDGRAVPTFLSPDLVSPYAHQYNASIERRFGQDTSIRLAYIGSRSVKLLSSYILNRAQPVPGIPLTLATVDERRPDPRYFETIHVVNAGLGYFNAGQVSVDWASSRGLRVNASYTFSKAIDEGADYTATAANSDLARGRSQEQFNALADKRGLSSFDTPHSLVGAYTYELPGPGRSGTLAAWFLNGWQVSGALLLKSGTPFTLYVGSDAPGFGNVDGGPGDRPNILDPSILGATIGHPDTAPQILRRDRFAFIGPGESRGNIARGSFRKARIGNWNASFNKTFVWAGAREWRVIVGAEAYNLTNTPQFDEPQRNLTSPSFGKITNTLNDGRVFQVVLRLML